MEYQGKKIFIFGFVVNTIPDEGFGLTISSNEGCLTGLKFLFPGIHYCKWIE